MPQKSGRDFGMWATPTFRPDVHPVRTETVHGSRISGMYTFDKDVWPGLARYWYTAFRIHVRHRCLHLFRPVLHVCGIFYLMGHKTILLYNQSDGRPLATNVVEGSGSKYMVCSEFISPSLLVDVREENNNSM